MIGSAQPAEQIIMLPPTGVVTALDGPGIVVFSIPASQRAAFVAELRLIVDALDDNEVTVAEWTPPASAPAGRCSPRARPS